MIIWTKNLLFQQLKRQRELMKVGNSIKIICPQSYSIEILMGKPKEGLNEIFQTIINKIAKRMLTWDRSNCRHPGQQTIKSQPNSSFQLPQVDQSQSHLNRLINIPSKNGNSYQKLSHVKSRKKNKLKWGKEYQKWRHMIFRSEEA